jgi:hypothetical protein
LVAAPVVEERHAKYLLYLLVFRVVVVALLVELEELEVDRFQVVEAADGERPEALARRLQQLPALAAELLH